jgi:ABC-2 type transport system permease protein
VTAKFHRQFLAHLRAELLKSVRVWAFSVPTLPLPGLFYAFFGLSGPGRAFQGVTVGAYLMASFSAVGVLSTMLFSFGVGVASERGQRMHVLLRASPANPLALPAAKIAVSALFALLSQAPVILLATTLGGVSLPPERWAMMLGSLMIGSVPFAALGFAIGYTASPNAAPAIANIVNLVLSFLSGLFVPLSQLPEAFQAIGRALPTHHLGQLAWAAVGASSGDVLASWAIVAAWGVLFLAAAAWAARREERIAFA